ncbi:hypothetical protein [Shimia sp.]|uniref:hypothetical protein n=1 Tax=Shimia sp. TaxID=1954381 RepID=UPI003B8CCAC0
MTNDTISFQQGALAVFDQDASGGETGAISRFIPFRFNPEDLNRELSVEQAQGQGAQPGGGGSDGGSADQGADADSGSLKEAFAINLKFDLAYREERASGNMPVKYGILPEISALEDLLHPVESETDQPSDGSEPTRARGRRPLVLFVWGERRVVPVKIVGMSINEQFFNGQLYPTRAEIDVSFEALGEGDARDNTRVSSSLKFTADNRRKMARIYLDTTASQGANINLPS